MNTDPLFKGAEGNKYNLKDSKPAFEVKQVDGGLLIGARRNAEMTITTGDDPLCRAMLHRYTSAG